MPTTNKEREIRIAQRRVEGFAQQFGEAHRNLARHAAFPLVLTPDLLYQIWANFVPEAPWTAVAHVLLSRLCRQVGYEMYEMDIADRNLLLRELKEESGQERFDDLGEFLLDYVAQRLMDDDADTQDLAQAHEWTALAYTKPDEAARELAQRLSERVQQEDMGEVLRLASLVENLAEPLVKAGFEPLLAYSHGMGYFARGDLESATTYLEGLLTENRRLKIAGLNLLVHRKIASYMAISSKLMQKLLPLLRPPMENESQRGGYLIRALGTDNPVLYRIVLNTPTNDFIPSLVNELVAFGDISPGKPALCALLEVIRENVGVDKQLEIDNLQQKIIEELTKKEKSSSVETDKHSRTKQMSFITELRTRLISDKQVYDLSRNEEFAEFNFIGLKETPLSVDLVAFTKADGFTEKQIVDLRDKFFNITQIVSYDFGLKPGPRMPNGLLGLVFEHECPRYLIEFIKKQTKISHWQRSAVLVSWVIDVKYKQIYTHNNPVSLFPPVVIMEDSVFPGLEYLKSFIYTYRSPSIHLDNDTKASIQNFGRLESRLEEIYKIIKTIPEQQSKYNFPNAKRVQIFEQVDTYIENNNTIAVFS
ncbi:MAG: hypothetical protein V7K88_19870 [Nostoc sp.]|uniref:hypothetical protein n=1 Tax=Nostoc sp. TaxID=1180 RepID=UPI002FF9A4E9